MGKDGRGWIINEGIRLGCLVNEFLKMLLPLSVCAACLPKT